MKPYYEDDLVTLYHGDCLEITDWLAADVLVTDPPYGIKRDFKQGSYRGRGEPQRRRKSADIAGDHSVHARDSAIAAWGAVKPRIVFGVWRAPRPEPVDHRLIWHKQGSVFGLANGSWISQDEEIYVTGNSFVRSSPPKRSVFATTEPRQGAHGAAALIGHPTPKPLPLMGWLIERCQPQWVIADPFAGSGSTLLAARNLGRQSIGVELEERYCELTAKRLSQQAFDLGDIA